MRLLPFWTRLKRTIQRRKTPDLARRDFVGLYEPICPAPRFLDLRGAGSGEVSDCFRVHAMFGESDIRGGRTPLP